MTFQKRHLDCGITKTGLKRIKLDRDEDEAEEKTGSTGNMRKGHSAFQTAENIHRYDARQDGKKEMGGMAIRDGMADISEGEVLEVVEVEKQDLPQDLLQNSTFNPDKVESLELSHDLLDDILSDGVISDSEPESEISETCFDGDISDSADDCNESLEMPESDCEVQMSPERPLHSQESCADTPGPSSDETQPELVSSASSDDGHRGDLAYPWTPRYIYVNSRSDTGSSDSESDSYYSAGLPNGNPLTPEQFDPYASGSEELIE